MATIAVFVALGGGAYGALGAIPDGSGVFHGCVDAQTGALRVAGNATSCRKATTVIRRGKKVRRPGEIAIAWNQEGPAGLNGAAGAPGPTGSAGPLGPQGPPGPFPTTLASGMSLTGVYRAGQTAAGDPLPSAVSFVYPLASKPTVHYIAPLAQPPAQCPGTADDPQAAPGHLRVYAAQGNGGVTIADPNTSIGPDASRFGFEVFDNNAGAITAGTWAVTAP